MVVPDDAKNRILLKATNIDEAIRKAEKHYKCEKKSLRVYTIKPPVSYCGAPLENQVFTELKSCIGRRQKLPLLPGLLRVQ